MPYMDPASAAYMYYQMAAQPFGFHPMHPFHNPYTMPLSNNMPHFGLYGSASVAGDQRHLQDDQQSIQSYHFDLDTRSEKNLNSRKDSVNITAFKHEPADGSGRTGLLIENSNQQVQNVDTHNLEPTLNLNETSSNLKRDELHRMTPQLHNLPHVRASFSLNNIIQVRANDPCEGQPALVDIINLTDLMEHYLTNLKNMKLNERVNSDYGNEFGNDEDTTSGISGDMRNEILLNYKMAQEFPGPLVKEHTSKAQLIQFCQKNVKECLSNNNINLIDPQSHALLWDKTALSILKQTYPRCCCRV